MSWGESAVRCDPSFAIPASPRARRRRTSSGHVLSIADDLDPSFVDGARRRTPATSSTCADDGHPPSRAWLVSAGFLLVCVCLASSTPQRRRHRAARSPCLARARAVASLRALPPSAALHAHARRSALHAPADALRFALGALELGAAPATVSGAVPPRPLSTACVRAAVGAFARRRATTRPLRARGGRRCRSRDGARPRPRRATVRRRAPVATGRRSIESGPRTVGRRSASVRLHARRVRPVRAVRGACRELGGSHGGSSCSPSAAAARAAPPASGSLLREALEQHAGSSAA